VLRRPPFLFASRVGYFEIQSRSQITSANVRTPTLTGTLTRFGASPGQAMDVWQFVTVPPNSTDPSRSDQ
jgi:hypothetical protein